MQLRILYTLILILSGFFSSTRPLFSYLNYPWEGLVFYATFFWIGYPFFRLNWLCLGKLESLFLRFVICFLLCLVELTWISTWGIYFGAKVGGYLLVLVSVLLVFFRKEKSFNILNQIKFSKQELLILTIVVLWTGYYSARYILKGSQGVPDADTASVAQISVYEFQGFPKIKNVIPITVDEKGEPTPSTVHIIQPPWISSLGSILSVLTRLDISRVFFWLWVFSPFLLFSGYLSILLTKPFSNLLKEKEFILIAVLCGFFAHNHQMHLTYSGGEVQEMFTMSLLSGALVLLIEFSGELWAALLIGGALSFQPDVAFPWALFLCLYFLFENFRNFSKVLKFSALVLGTMSGFLSQQVYNFLDTGLRATDFVTKSYQILVMPSEIFSHFQLYLIFYGVGMLACFALPGKVRKLFFVFISIFIFYTFYPLVIHFLNPSATTLDPSEVYPFKIYGKFHDFLLPFTGKYYFYRMSISWGLIVATLLGASVIFNRLKKFKRSLITFLVLGNLIWAVYIDKTMLLKMGSLISTELVEEVSYLNQKWNMDGPTLVPQASDLPSSIAYQMWWISSLINSLAEGSRATTSESDLFINYKYHDNLFAPRFWGKILKGEAAEKDDFVQKAASVYKYALVPVPLCGSVFDSAWNKLDSGQIMCLYQSKKYYEKSFDHHPLLQ